jgi:putative oxygen-independent coproporphyrinogen III oxidase
VFFGGGTPSLLSPDQVGAVLAVVPRAPGAEVTVECNPETISPSLLEGYRRVGVNRISIGVQATSPEGLRALGRAHRPEAVPAAVAVVRAAGFPTFNTDLIFGAAGGTLRSWRQTLDAVLELEPPHVSAYALTVEPGTPLAADPSRHPDPDLQADMYALADEVLTGAGLDWYEVSNWARPGHECRHNLLYWAQGNYRGLGCAAHSHADGRRWWNVRTPERYIRCIEEGRPAEAAGETLDGATRRVEGLELALRTRRGVPMAALATGDELVQDGLVQEAGDRAVLTRRGRLLANEVALRLRDGAPTGS